MFRRSLSVLIATGGALALSVVVGLSPALAAVPSGERTSGQSTIEPAYNIDGSIIYLRTPDHAKVNLHPNSPVAPIYVIMYPTSAAGSIGVVNCAHQPADNCPDHGPLLAGLAESTVPSVYGGGVWGHDHLLAAPGSGGDFNILWEPVAVMFKDTAFVTHVTTLAQLQSLEDAGRVTEIPLRDATFHCSVEKSAAYDRGTPVTSAPPAP